MYKLIAIDLDGTLLNDEKIITDENIDTVRKALASGYKIAFATGRRYLAAKEFISLFDEDVIIIANNGNMIRHTKTDELVDYNYLDKKHLKDILSWGKDMDLHPTIHVNRFDEGIDMIHELEKNDPRYCSYLINEDRIERVKDFNKEDLNILSVVYLGDYKKLEALYEKIKKNHDETYQLYLMNSTTIADGLLEVVSKNSNKWKSVLEYANSVGIKQEEIISIGDDANDISMVKQAGFGIAMKNGIDSIKEVADMVTEFDNNNSGVSRALEKVLKL